MDPLLRANASRIGVRHGLAIVTWSALFTLAGGARADEPRVPAAGTEPAPQLSAPPASSAQPPSAPSDQGPPTGALTDAPARVQVQGVVPPGAKQPGDGRRLVGAVVGAAGFMTLAVGTFLTISAMTLYDEAESRCRNGPCDRTDVKDAEVARDRANAGGWVLLGGTALLAGGIVLYVTAPRADDPAPKDPAEPKAAARAFGFKPTLGGLAAFGTF